MSIAQVHAFIAFSPLTRRHLPRIILHELKLLNQRRADPAANKAPIHWDPAVLDLLANDPSFASTGSSKYSFIKYAGQGGAVVNMRVVSNILEPLDRTKCKLGWWEPKKQIYLSVSLKEQLQGRCQEVSGYGGHVIADL